MCVVNNNLCRFWFLGKSFAGHEENVRGRFTQNDFRIGGAIDLVME